MALMTAPHLVMLVVVVMVLQRRCCLHKLRPAEGLLRPRESGEEVEGRGEVLGHGRGARGPEEEVNANDGRPQQARGGPAGGPGEEERAGWVVLAGFGVAALVAAALLFVCVWFGGEYFL